MQIDSIRSYRPQIREPAIKIVEAFCLHFFHFVISKNQIQQLELHGWQRHYTGGIEDLGFPFFMKSVFLKLTQCPWPQNLDYGDCLLPFPKRERLRWKTITTIQNLRRSVMSEFWKNTHVAIHPFAVWSFCVVNIAWWAVKGVLALNEINTAINIVMTCMHCGFLNICSKPSLSATISLSMMLN